MSNRLSILGLGLISCALVSGCNVGSAPAGMSRDDAKAAIARMSPEQKIRAIASSPMPQAEKEKEYAKIEAESGVKAGDILRGGPPTGGGG